MERKLATIDTITDLQPIEGADSIEVATIRGWKVVVKKGDFKVGNLCVYCEVDSLMPPKPEFEFLKPRNYRIKTIKLRGQISQGIAFPIQILPREYFTPNRKIEPVPGMDVTAALGVVKYEPPVPAQLSGLVKGSFPGFIPKTDEERVQNIPWVLEKYPEVDFYATEKLDGSSVTLYLNNGEFGVCSRNLELKETEENTIWRVVRAMDIEQKMRAAAPWASAGENYALQGELIGEGIQKNRYRLKGQTIRFFNAFNIDKGEYIGCYNFLTLLNMAGLELVPLIDPRDVPVGIAQREKRPRHIFLPKTMDEMLAMADGPSILNPKQNREGIVLRSVNEQSEPDIPNGRLSFKVISNKFLLKDEE